MKLNDMLNEDAIAYPVVNRNGTGWKDLSHEATTACYVLRDAIKAVGDMTVHGRDFQTGGSYSAYREQATDRLRRLQSVYDELEQVAMKIMDQER